MKGEAGLREIMEIYKILKRDGGKTCQDYNR
jgi:hypothetical protein